MFKVLDSTDSTNNYAMAQVHAGLAKHGMAWFSHEQTSGKGQHGKAWETGVGESIALSIALVPLTVFSRNQFYFNAAIANSCYDFFKSYGGNEISIKWPNDIYWRDRKAGGILIENKVMGKNWKWAVVGIGININQLNFSYDLPNPVSLKQITGKGHDVLKLAKELHNSIVSGVDLGVKDLPFVLKQYNQHLYKKDQLIKVKKGNAVFETKVKEVNEFGQLVTVDTMERQFSFGEIQFVVTV
ncbi:MAG: biotin--[acetyl-CoA-carboxylase] ligase [Ferruginibacter sp.]